MSSTDPLIALRSSIKAHEPITTTPTHILINTQPFPKSTPTRYRKPAPSNDFYTLDALYLAWSLRDAPGAEYMKHAREAGLAVGFVSVTERKSVVEYLEGGDGGDRVVGVDAQGSTTPSGTPPRPSHSSLSPSKSQKAEHHHAPHSSATTTATPKKRYMPDSADMEVVKKIKLNEVELRDRNTVLRGIKANNFTTLRTTYADKLKKLKEATRSGAPVPSTSTTPDPKHQARKARNYYPIIMISSSPTALLTMHNIKRFLQESIFEHPQEARARATSKPEDLIAIYRNLPGLTNTTQRYFIVDSTEALSKFGPDAWDRVVCVMTTGQAWQFRPYKWKEPRTLFHHVKGVYVQWSNDPPNPKIKDWNVSEMKIDPHRRHVDKQTVAQFWKELDTWVAANRPGLMKPY